MKFKPETEGARTPGGTGGIRVEQAGVRWITTETKPEAERAVLLCVIEGKREIIIRAKWVPRLAVVVHGDYDGDTDYDEATDENYWPEGWYEWNQHEDTHWLVTCEPTHWMKLPEPPNVK